MSYNADTEHDNDMMETIANLRAELAEAENSTSSLPMPNWQKGAQNEGLFVSCSRGAFCIVYYRGYTILS